jgi:hypothetical protein
MSETSNADVEAVEDRIERYTRMSLADARALLAADPSLSENGRIAMLAVIEATIRKHHRAVVGAEAAPGSIH